VPPPAVAELTETVTATAEPVTLDATMLLTLFTVPDEGVRVVQVVALVVDGIK
jgi:hypothetical protein